MKLRQKTIVFAVLLCLTLMMTATSAIATTPSLYSRCGAPNYGPMAREYTTIKLEGEKLIYSIVDLPYNYGHSEPAPASKSSLTAEYRLVNTDTEQQSITLFSPVTYSQYPDHVQSEVIPSFSLNGQAIEPVIRHSYTRYPTSFDERELNRVYDDYLTSANIPEDITVTKYIVDVSNIVFPGTNYANLICTTENYGNTSRGYFLNTEYTKFIEDYRNDYLVMPVRGDVTVELYVFGPKSDKLPTFEVYYTYRDMLNGKSPYLADINITESETLTLNDFIMQNYDPNGEISEMDWHNLVMTELSNQKVSGHAIELNGYTHNYDGYVRKWYETTITLDAGERAVYTTVMPLYPDEIVVRDPHAFSYHYTGADIARVEGCEIEREINSPYYVLDSYKSRNYTAFDLCEVDNPKYVQQGNNTVGNTIVSILLYPIVMIVRFFDWVGELIKKIILGYSLW